MPVPMRVIVFASQKGGSGKTTLAGHLAVQAQLAGAGPVAMIDTDPQGSLEQWAEARSADQPEYIKADPQGLGRALADARTAGKALVFVDTPPSVTRAISEVVSHADLVVVPTRPSPHDLRAVGPTVDIAEWHKKTLVFAINCAAKRARITSDAAVALSQHGTVAPSTIHNRVDFAASMIDGRTVMEAKPDGPSAKEIAALWDYIADRLARMNAHYETMVDPTPLTKAAPNHLNALGRRAPAFGRRAH